MAEKLTVTEQIGMWLAKADASDNEHEKEMFYSRAQEVATRCSIDMAVARRAVAKGQQRETPTHKTIVLGKRGQRALSWYVELALAVARNNDLRVTMAHNSTFVNLYGFPSDIEVTEAMYVSAVSSMAQLADAYLKAGEYKKDVQPRRVKIRTENPDYNTGYNWGAPKYLYRWTYVDKAVSGMTARQNFYAGFVGRINERLREAKRLIEEQKLSAEQVATLAPEDRDMSTALVLKEKSREVTEFYQSQISGRKMGSWNGSKSPVYSGGARAAGGAAANGVSLGQSGGTLPGARRALGS